MILKFDSHSIKENNGESEIILCLNTNDFEFAKEISKNHNVNSKDINESVLQYINRNLPTVKNALIKVMSGTVLICTVSLGTLHEAAAKESISESLIEEAIESSPVIKTWLNEEPIIFNQKPILIRDTTYIPIREFCDKFNLNLNWNKENDAVEIKKNDKTIEFVIGNEGATLNGKSILMPRSIVAKGNTMVPVRLLSEGLGYDVKWDAEGQIIHISDNNNFIKSSKEMPYESITKELEVASVATSGHTEDDLYWLSRLIHAEAQGEPYEGKLGVANVIINRAKSDTFPNVIKDVIFDTDFSVQFPPTITGEINNEPNAESIKAAKSALEGKNNIGNALYFTNPATSTNKWIIENRKFAFTIGNHDFYY